MITLSNSADGPKVINMPVLEAVSRRMYGLLKVFGNVSCPSFEERDCSLELPDGSFHGFGKKVFINFRSR